MTNHPIDVTIVDGVNVAKADVRGYEKQYVRLRFADATAVRNTKLSGQFGGVYVLSLKAFFDIDTTDTTTADDGLSCIIDFDGNRFKKVVVSSSLTQRKITSAGDVTLADNDADIIVVAKTVGASTNVYLPNASVRTAPIRIVDGKYDAFTNNITINPKIASGQTIMGGGTYVIDSNGASITFIPLADGTGWV